MQEFQVGETVWWFDYEMSPGKSVVYAQWLLLLKGRVVWVDHSQEIMHVYRNGCESLYIMLSTRGYAHGSQECAIEAMQRMLEE